MAENIVEDIRLLEIIHLRFRADERAGRKALIGEMVEEHLVRHKPVHRHDAPAGQFFETGAELFHVRNAMVRKLKLAERRREFIAGAARQHFSHPREQPVPAFVLVGGIGCPILIDRMVCVALDVRVAIAPARLGILVSHEVSPQTKGSVIMIAPPDKRCKEKKLQM